jgi:tRNA 2-selenouridine synthase
LHGHEKIKRWQAMAEIEDMETLVHELLVQHYDPAYLRSIDRNFLRYGAAQALTLADISETSFQAAASVLLQNQTVTGLP